MDNNWTIWGLGNGKYKVIIGGHVYELETLTAAKDFADNALKAMKEAESMTVEGSTSYVVERNDGEAYKPLALDAMLFAMEAHKDHKRKYTKVPYFMHLAEVAGILSTVRNDEDSIATAWLQYCIEDCGVDFTFIAEKFSRKVAIGVYLLSDLEKGNREERKRKSMERLGEANDWIQDIKVCDLISNTPSIVQHDPKFAITYLEEKKLLLEVLTKADNRLLEIAWRMINDR